MNPGVVMMVMVVVIIDGDDDSSGACECDGRIKTNTLPYSLLPHSPLHSLTISAIGLFNPVFDDPNHDLVRHQVASCHRLFGQQTNLRFVLEEENAFVLKFER